jgi:zinc protease
MGVVPGADGWTGAAFCPGRDRLGPLMVLRGRIALAVLVTLMAGACAAGRSPAPARNARPAPERYVLANGARVVVEEHRLSDVAAVQLWVAAGGRDEAASELGLAHYLEHMLFKGTATRPGRAIDRAVEESGGRMNAGTSLDYTYYHMVLPASRTPVAIELLADIAVNATLDEGLLEAEKRVVLEEMRLGRDNPARFLSRTTWEAAFEGHPYGRPVIGTEPLIANLTREQLVAFYRRLYVPENFTLVVVGPVDPREVRQLAARAFGRLPRSGASRLPAPPPPALRPRAVEQPRPGVHAHLSLAWPAPPLDHADTPAVDLLVAVLGQSRSSRLTRALRERLGLVQSVSAGYSALQAAGLVTVTAQLDPANLAAAERGILTEVGRLRAEGVSATEHERALTAAEAQREFLGETAEGRARLLGHAETVWRLEEEARYLDRLRAVTPEQIRAAAQRYLDPERYVKVTLVPPSR